MIGKDAFGSSGLETIEFKEGSKLKEMGEEVSAPNSLYWLPLLFGKARSRLTGYLMDLALPPTYREGVLNFWATPPILSW